MTATTPTATRTVTARARRGPAVLLAVAAVVLGVAAGRFVLYRPDGAAPGVAGRGGPPSPEQRVEQLEAAARRTPDDVQTLQSLGAAYVQLVAAGGDVSLYNAAEAVLDRAAERAPGDPRVLLTQGYLALARHDFALARDLGSQARAIDAFDPDALAVLVDAGVELGRYDEAAVYLQTMLDLRPGLAAYSRVSYLRELHGDVIGARRAFAQAETAGTDRYDLATVAVLRGKLALNHGDVDEASARFAQARGHVETPAGVEAGEARVLAARGNVEGAIAVLERAVEERPTAEVAILQGDLLRLEGRQADARRADEVVRDLARRERAAGADVDMEMALFEADRGHPARALALARAAHTRKPDNVTANIALAWALRATGAPESALPYVERALRLGTRDGLLHFRAAAVLADTGQNDRARAELATAFEINPRFSFGHQQQARELAVRLGVPVGATYAKACQPETRRQDCAERRASRRAAAGILPPSERD
jgi:tetratricopeptide (TPR) repeat protein